MPPKPPQPNEAADQAKAEAVRLADAYVTVFGTEKKRTDAQRLVWQDLSLGVDDEKNPTFNLSNAQLDGLTLIAQGLKRDGAKGIIRLIKDRISQAVTLRETPKSAAKVKR
jgi:hypothetical protein